MISSGRVAYRLLPTTSRYGCFRSSVRSRTASSACRPEENPGTVHDQPAALTLGQALLDSGIQLRRGVRVQVTPQRDHHGVPDAPALPDDVQQVVVVASRARTLTATHSARPYAVHDQMGLR
jgi:hypothetical protein